MTGFIEKFRPSEYVEDLIHVDLKALKEQGFDSIIIDLDNTLVPWKNESISDAVYNWVNLAKELGFKICILSNTRNPNRLNRIANKLGIPSIHPANKPKRGGFFKTLEFLGSSADKTIVIGDQLLTDVLGGNRSGLYTILLNPIETKEFFGTKISRIFERIILKKLSRMKCCGTFCKDDKSKTGVNK